MRRILLGSIAALALGAASPAAFAADMAVPEPAPVMSWTGFYLGAGGGVSWADLDINHRHCLLDEWDNTICDANFDEFRRDFNESSDGGIIGIVQGGFDYELAPSFVVGVGADWTFGEVFGDNEGRFHDDDFGFDSRFNNDGSSLVDVYGRAGFAPTQSLLIFGLVGWTWADIETDFRIRDEFGDTVFHNSDNFNANGLSFGGGVEWKFTDNLSIRGEYRFTDLDNFDNNGNFEVCNDGCGNFRSRNDVDLDVQRVLFTLNWRFGGFGGASTAAAY
jgi:outer membrane immunogenic protein